MTHLLHRLRLVPIVLVAATGLFLLKVTGIILAGGYTLGAGHQARNDRAVRDATVVTQRSQPASEQQRSQPASEQQRRPKSWAQDMFGYPDVTGSVGASPEPAKDAPPPKAPATPPKTPGGTVVQLESTNVSPSERALLERLSERRKELEKRQSELEMRDTLLKAAEKKLEERLGELKQAEERIVAATQQREEVELHRLKNLVTMYESMKAKDAAKIFDGLDLKLATEVAKLIQPRRMSDILAQMSPEAAQRLTVELASRPAGDGTTPSKQELPKIEGRPSGS